MTECLENYLLPCHFKSATGIDCPGCGFQRAVISFLNGDMGESFMHYPPLFFLLGFLSMFWFTRDIKSDTRYKILMFSLIIYLLSILVNYIIKFI